jgi:cell division septum initiation protein DivIVA
MDKIMEENEQLKKRIEELEERLKSYTSTHRQKKYYENHSDVIKQKTKEYSQKLKETNPEKIKEWNHRAYLKRKDKLKNEKNV